MGFNSNTRRGAVFLDKPFRECRTVRVRELAPQSTENLWVWPSRNQMPFLNYTDNFIILKSLAT